MDSTLHGAVYRPPLHDLSENVHYGEDGQQGDLPPAGGDNRNLRHLRTQRHRVHGNTLSSSYAAPRNHHVGPDARAVPSEYSNRVGARAPTSGTTAVATEQETAGKPNPIRESVRNRALGRKETDPLLEELLKAGAPLPATLASMLTEPADTPDATISDEMVGMEYQLAQYPCFRSQGEVDIANDFAGVAGIGGVMVPIDPDSKQHPAERLVSPQSPSQRAPTTTSTTSPVRAGPGFNFNYHFVGNEGADGSKNGVRKHVMREYRRRQKWELERRRASEPQQQPSSAVEGLVQWLDHEPAPAPASALEDRKVERAAVLFNFQDALAELEKNRDLPYTSDPYAAIAASNLDPFSRMQLGPATRSLVHHFAWVMPSLMDEIVTGTVFHRIGWLYSAVAIHDPTPSHVIIGFTLGHIARMRGQAPPEMALHHKSLAFKAVRDRLLDPRQGITDDTIGAMVNIAAWEMISRNPKNFSMHMTALHAMIVRRGGLEALARKPELQSVLIRLDAIRAYITLSAPRYPHHFPIRSLHALAIPIPQELDNKAVYPCAKEVREHAFCEDMLRLVHDLEDVLLLLHTISREPPASEFSVSTTEVAENSILQCLSTTNCPKSAFAHDVSRRTARLAALVLIDAAILQFFDGEKLGPSTKRLSARFLGQRLDKFAMASWGRSLEMIVHVLLAADRCALEQPCRAWYVADALTVTMRLDEHMWTRVEAQLREYLDERCREDAAVTDARYPKLWQLKSVYEKITRAWKDWSTQ